MNTLAKCLFLGVNEYVWYSCQLHVNERIGKRRTWWYSDDSFVEFLLLEFCMSFRLAAKFN